MRAGNVLGADSSFGGSARQLAIARASAAVGLAYIAVIHVLDAGGKWGETRYIFWLYIALIIDAIAAVALLLREESRRVWSLCAVVAASPLIGYVLNRTTGLPQATKDIGNWGEPLGLLSVIIEACVLAICLYRLLRPAPLRNLAGSRG